MPQRIRLPLVSGGLQDSAADAHGMERNEALELENAYFNTPSSLSVRPGSANGDALQDDQGSPADLTSVPYVGFWPDKDKAVAVGHSTTTDKHYLYTLDADGKNPTRYAMPAAYAVADPLTILGVPWFGSRFYVFDHGGFDAAVRKGLVKFDGAATTLPTFQLGSGPAAALRPKHGFVHKNHLIVLGYGDENTVNAPDLMRYSNPGDPDTFQPTHRLGIGETGEALLGGISNGEFAMLFKARKTYRLEGNGHDSWSVQPADLTMGLLSPAALLAWGGWVWFVSELGPARISPGGPAQLLVDPVKLKWSEFDNHDNDWVTVHPEEFCIGFGFHRASQSGTFPDVELIVDWRSGAWALRNYGLRARHAAMIPQVSGGDQTAGPLGPPTIGAASAIGTNGWTANWTNGDTRTGTTTRHESKDTDAAGSFAQDASAAAGATSIAITGKNAGRIYRERVRHERNGIFSTYSPDTTGQEVKTLQDTPGISLSAEGGVGVTVQGANPNQYSDIVIQRALDNAGVPGAYSTVHTSSTPGSSYSWVDSFPATHFNDSFWYRVKATRAGFTDSAWAEAGPIQCPPP